MIQIMAIARDPPHRVGVSRSFVVLVLVALTSGCNRPEQPRKLGPAPSASAYPVVIHQPVRLTSVDTGRTDARGEPVRAACVTCHSMREADGRPTPPTSAADLKEFHVGLRFEHGELSCASCHRSGQPPMLGLADGRSVPTSEAMQLCAQCHGPQYRDYKHSAHGGGRGHWDLSRGGRDRNHCVDCHDPHVPRFQPSTPVLPPRDRGVTQGQKEAKHG